MNNIILLANLLLLLGLYGSSYSKKVRLCQSNSKTDLYKALKFRGCTQNRKSLTLIFIIQNKIYFFFSVNSVLWQNNSISLIQTRYSLTKNRYSQKTSCNIFVKSLF